MPPGWMAAFKGYLENPLTFILRIRYYSYRLLHLMHSINTLDPIFYKPLLYAAGLDVKGYLKNPLTFILYCKYSITVVDCCISRIP